MSVSNLQILLNLTWLKKSWIEWCSALLLPADGYWVYAYSKTFVLGILLYLAFLKLSRGGWLGVGGWKIRF